MTAWLLRVAAVCAAAALLSACSGGAAQVDARQPAGSSSGAGAARSGAARSGAARSIRRAPIDAGVHTQPTDPAPAHGSTQPPTAHSEHQEQLRAHGGDQPHKMHTKHHRFRDAAKWAKIFESAKRDKWQRGDAVVASLKLTRDSRIADIGAGTGYFAIRFAKRVRSGVVYAVDIEPTMVDWVVKRARRQRLENLVGVVSTAQSAKLPGAVDVIFLSNTYHHIAERPSYFARLQRQLRPGGRVIIVDFKMGKLPVGPPDSHKIGPAQIVAEMTAASYRLVRRDDKLLPYQHVLVFKAK